MAKQIKKLILDLKELRKLESAVRQINFTEYNRNNLFQIEELL